MRSPEWMPVSSLRTSERKERKADQHNRAADGGLEDLEMEDNGAPRTETDIDADEFEGLVPRDEIGFISDEACNSNINSEEDAAALPAYEAEVPTSDINGPLKIADRTLRQLALADSGTTLMAREILKEVIEEDSSRWGGCFVLPVTLIFFVLYSAAASLHEEVTFTHLLNKPVRSHLLDPLSEVDTPDELWQFLEDVYTPFFFRQTDSVGQPLPVDRWGTIGQYSQLVGGVQMNLYRSVQKPCSAEASHIQCYPHDDLTDVPFGRNLADLPPLGNLTESTPLEYWDETGSAMSLLNCADEGFSVAGCNASQERRLKYLQETFKRRMPAGSSGDPTYTFLLDSKQPLPEIMLRLRYLRDRRWLDAQSTVLVVRAVVLNNQLYGPRLQLVTTTFYFSRGGGIFTSLRVETTTLELFTMTVSYVVDALFALVLFVTSCESVGYLCVAVRQRKFRQYLTAMNFCTWLSCSAGWGNIFGLLLVENYRQSAKSRLKAYFDDPSLENSQELYSAVQTMMVYVSYTRVLIADAHILFMCRCFVALQWQPRLSVVTQTLVECFSDLFHYLIVFVCTASSFAISGMIIFGRYLREFASVDASILTCFKLAVESEYDWVRLSQKGNRTALIWTGLYLVMIVVLMVNMILAIIMDVYQEVRKNSGNNMTIWEQLTYMYHKISHRKQWVSSKDLLERIDEMNKTILLTELRLAFPEMHHLQLEYLMRQCKNKAQKIKRVGINKQYLPQMIAAIHLGLDEVSSNLNRLKERGWMGTGIEVGSDKNREFVKEIFASIAMQKHWMGLTAKHISTMQLRAQGITPEEELERDRSRRDAAGRSVKME